MSADTIAETYIQDSTSTLLGCPVDNAVFRKMATSNARRLFLRISLTLLTCSKLMSMKQQYSYLLYYQCSVHTLDDMSLFCCCPGWLEPACPSSVAVSGCIPMLRSAWRTTQAMPHNRNRTNRLAHVDRGYILVLPMQEKNGVASKGRRERGKPYNVFKQLFKPYFIRMTASFASSKASHNLYGIW